MLSRFLRLSCFPKAAGWLLGFSLVLGLMATAGCTLARSLMVQTAPTTEKVAPEFNRLAGKQVLVYVWAPPEILWDYPKVRLDLAAQLSAYLAKNVKGLTVVDPLRVEAHIEKSSDSDRDPVAVGRHFRADMVVHLAIYKLSMRDPGMSHFQRGRIGSSVVVHDLTQADTTAQRTPLKDVEVAVPDEGPVGFLNMRPEQVRQATYDAFTIEVGKKFHEYERPVG